MLVWTFFFFLYLFFVYLGPNETPFFDARDLRHPCFLEGGTVATGLTRFGSGSGGGTKTAGTVGSFIPNDVVVGGLSPVFLLSFFFFIFIFIR
jgi:hypothetical protein